MLRASNYAGSRSSQYLKLKLDVTKKELKLVSGEQNDGMDNRRWLFSFFTLFTLGWKNRY